MSKTDVLLQVCISERKGGGSVVYNENHSVTPGEQRIALGSFGRNPYVMRVGVDETLVKNLPFSVD